MITVQISDGPPPGFVCVAVCGAPPLVITKDIGLFSPGPYYVEVHAYSSKNFILFYAYGATTFIIEGTETEKIVEVSTYRVF
jgi:hypothetical protein